MALVKNSRGEWAWVDNPGDTPEVFYATTDEALAAAKPSRLATTTDAGKTVDGARTREVGEWL